MKIQQLIEGVILALLTLVIYLFTINPVTKPYAIYALGLSLLLVLGVYLYSLRHANDHSYKMSPKLVKVLAFSFATAILLWVGTTGWYFSRFFYLLYLLGISLAFLFSTSAAFSFTLVLVAILLPSVGEINANFDVVTVVSLLLIVPLSYFLSRTYLKVKEKEKKILILEGENKFYSGKVEELLRNVVTRVSVDLREPLNDIKQLAYYSPKLTSTKKREEYRKRIIKSSEKALQILKGFEEETTGRKLLRNPK